MKVHHYHLFDFFTIISISLIYFAYYFGNRKIDFFEKYRLSFIFLFACLFSSLFMKIDVIGQIFQLIISRTYVRRFRGYSLYPYILISCGIYSLYYILINSRIRDDIKKKVKNAGIIIIIFAMLIGISELFIYHIKNDKYNHSYIMRKNNVYSYINEHVSLWSVICSYGHPSLEITSQTPNFVIGVHFTHHPAIGVVQNRRERDMFSLLSIDLPIKTYLDIAKKYECNYLMIENDKDYYNTNYGRENKKYFSIISTKRKMKLFPEIFSEIFKDDKYILININNTVDINSLLISTKNELQRLALKNKIEDAYELTHKLLLLERSQENYKINEKLRNILANINSDKSRLTYSFSFMSISSNTNFYTFLYDLPAFMDQDAYSSKKDAIYLAAKETIKYSNIGQYIQLDFQTIRSIRKIKIKWYSKELRAIDFKIEYYADETYKNLYEIKNNKNVTLALNLKNPIKMRRLKITVYKNSQNRLLMKSLEVM